jgi:hypothetical protein
MKMRVFVVLVLCLLAMLPVALADEGATWYPVPVSFSWDLSMAGACGNETQCLVHRQGNSLYDADSARWFMSTDPHDWPHCINNSQSILDYVCERGNWTTRTKSLALQMLHFADTASPSNYTLFCDSYARVLNHYAYSQDLPSLNTLVSSLLGEFCTIGARSVGCVNSICVLRTQQNILIGTTLNVPVNNPSKSFLSALNKSVALCDSVPATATVFTQCSQNVWYNPALRAVIFVPAGTLTPPASAIGGKIAGPIADLNSYVRTFLNNPTNPGLNFAYFARVRLFNHVYAAQDGNRAVFGFLQANLIPEENPIPMDLIGIRYTNMDIGPDPCLNLIKRYDNAAFCENQTGVGFNVIARHRWTPSGEGASPIVAAWPALTGKLRP